MREASRHTQGSTHECAPCVGQRSLWWQGADGACARMVLWRWRARCMSGVLLHMHVLLPLRSLLGPLLLPDNLPK